MKEFKDQSPSPQITSRKGTMLSKWDTQKVQNAPNLTTRQEIARIYIPNNTSAFTPWSKAVLEHHSSAELQQAN